MVLSGWQPSVILVPPWQSADRGQVCLPSEMTWARAGSSVPLRGCFKTPVGSDRDYPGDKGFFPHCHMYCPCPNPGCRAASRLVIKALVLCPSPCHHLPQKLHFHVRGLFLLRGGCEDKQWKEGLKKKSVQNRQNTNIRTLVKRA